MPRLDTWKFLMELSNEENGDFLRFLVFLCYSISFQFIPFSDFGTPTKSIIARVQGSPKTSESMGPTDLGQSPQIFGLEFGTPRLKFKSMCLPLKSYNPPEKGKGSSSRGVLPESKRLPSVGSPRFPPRYQKYAAVSWPYCHTHWNCATSSWAPLEWLILERIWLAKKDGVFSESHTTLTSQTL